MDALDREALHSDYQGEDDLDREALNYKDEFYELAESMFPETDGTTCSILESMGVKAPKVVPGHPSYCKCAYCKKLQKN